MVTHQWTVTISSVPTGATDKNDDGRRLKLALFDAQGNRLYQGATDPESDDWPAPVYTNNNSWSRSGVLTFTAAEGVKPAVLKLEKLDDAEEALLPNYNGTTDYIDTVTITSTGPSPFTVKFVAERWISSSAGCIAPEYATNVLFAATSLPQDDSPYVRNLRQLELAKLRGDAHKPSGFEEGFKGLTKEQKEGARKGSTAIYDYQTYNDLGKPDSPRPTLGGTDNPYPRRLATHLATEGGIEPPPSANQLPWLPLDEQFSFTKGSDFNNGKIAAALPALITGLKHFADEVLTGDTLRKLLQSDRDQAGGLLALAAKGTFDSFRDVQSHYNNDVQKDPLAPNMSTPQAKETKVKPSIITESGRQDDTQPQGLDGKVRSWLSGLQDRFDDSIMFCKRTGEAKVGVQNLLKLAGEILQADILDNMKKPRVLVKRPNDVVSKDWEFGRQMLAGFNPSTITALRQMPRELGSAISDDDVAGDIGADGFTMEGLVKAAADGEKPRLYLVDYWAPFAELFKESWKEDGKVLHAGRALFYLKQDAKTGEDVSLEPIAIELAAHPGKPVDVAPTGGVVYSRSKLRASNAEEVWELAKLVFRSLNVGVHQLISHWLRCHAAIEPFLIALRRQISTAHPVYKLMLPHFRYTMNINASARSNLINAGGIIEQTFAPGSYAMRLSSQVYKLTWRFKSQALPEDLRERGMVDAEGKPFISYPYAEDGLAIWNAMEAYFAAYLAHYYGSGTAGDSKVAADEELQAFWNDVTTKAHPDLQDNPSHWGLQDPSRISTQAELVRILVTIAWTASAHHAAVNFGQYDFTSYPLNAPSLIRKAMPSSKDDPSWKALVKTKGRGRDYEQKILSYINSPVTNLVVALTVQLLSTHSEDEQLLDEPNTLLTDNTAQALNKKFIADMKQLEQKIINTHKDGQDWTRCQPGANRGNPATWSTCLIPGSASGLTMRGVPFSVSI